jgi:hypothetical protein
VKLSPLGTSATNGYTVPAPEDDDDECGTIDGMRTGRGNRSIRKKKPSPLVPLSPPQIPHGLTWARIQTTAGGKPASNHISYGTAYWDNLLYFLPPSHAVIAPMESLPAEWTIGVRFPKGRILFATAYRMIPGTIRSQSQV